MLLGQTVAAALRGSWRRCPPPLEVSAGQLAEILPLVIGGGTASLVWSRVRAGELRDFPGAADLQHAYRMNSLYAALQERETVEVVRRLRGRGIEPVLVKGWAVGRFYPEKGFRPSTDVDLCVQPDRFPDAQAVIAAWPDRQTDFDVHPGYPKLYDRAWDELYARSELVPFAGEEVRVLSAEDHFRLICFHALIHGLWRALWLCDVAVLVESRPESFDWGYCLNGEPRYREWLPACVGLSHQLLGTELVGTPFSDPKRHVPGWLPPAVLRQWARGTGVCQFGLYANSVKRSPLSLLTEAGLRWRDPVRATIELNAPFNDMPRLPLQVVATLRRAPDFFRGLTKAFSQPPAPRKSEG